MRKIRVQYGALDSLGSNDLQAYVPIGNNSDRLQWTWTMRRITNNSPWTWLTTPNGTLTNLYSVPTFHYRHNYPGHPPTSPACLFS